MVGGQILRCVSTVPPDGNPIIRQPEGGATRAGTQPEAPTSHTSHEERRDRFWPLAPSTINSWNKSQRRFAVLSAGSAPTNKRLHDTGSLKFNLQMSIAMAVPRLTGLRRRETLVPFNGGG